MTAAVPAVAGAYATIAPENIYSSASGLPDGRVYEQVSPVDKNGNEAGAGTSRNDELPGFLHSGKAAPNGNSVLFEGTGPFGETASPLTAFFVATKNESAAGWSTRSVTPRPQQTLVETGGEVNGRPASLDLSLDLTHAMVVPNSNYTLAPLPNRNCGGQMFLTGPDPFVAATWLDRPEIANPVEHCNPDTESENGRTAGGTPNFSTVYFSYVGTLLPEDASRAPHSLLRNPTEGGFSVEGFYEYSEGALREAGVLPDGSLDPFGAVPAEVSTDGLRAFFLSPDPASCEENSGQNNCIVDPPELYLRENNGARIVLVSRDMLLPDVAGLPAPAPADSEGSAESLALVSPDGSQVFFHSEDRLTASAPEGPPGNVTQKLYDFDSETGALTYLPNVVGQLMASSEDGSSFAFVRPEAGSSPAELDLWSAGPSGGSVTPITQLPHAGGGASGVRMSSDGSVVVFSAGGLPGFNDAGAGEIFRYDVAANTLGCVSCAPSGVVPATALMGGRGISADGSRVFFVTRAPLVPQDTNTDSPPQLVESAGEENKVEPQGLDVYEWENGVVYLISSGKSERDAYLLDSSESGDDVFFATTEGLVPGDTDGGYDVYDARVPQPGDNLPPAAVPCEGTVCQGPPHVPSPLTPPASVTFSGLGNPVPEPAVTPVPPKKATTKIVKCANGKKLLHGKCVRKSKNKKSKAKKLAKGSK